MSDVLAVADGLVVRAAVYQVLALGYGYPTDAQREQVGDLATDLAGWIGHVQPSLVDALESLGACWTNAGVAGLEADFNRLFSGGVECPLHEGAYEPDIFRRQRSLADIVGFYRAFGFDLGSASRWQADHIGVELDFCAIVLQRQAQATDEGLDEPVEVCSAALRSFLDDHLGRWARSFRRLLHQKASADPYHHLAKLTEMWIGAELNALGLRPEPLSTRPRSAADDDEAPECGACPAVQEPRTSLPIREEVGGGDAPQ